jgi:exodeoxyribonuclease VII small subunit
MTSSEAPADLDRRPVGDLSFTEASHQLDEIVSFFEQRDVDVDEMVARLERATAIVDELDRRLRRTRAQVEELVPRLTAAVAAEAPASRRADEGSEDFDEVEVLDELVVEEYEIADDAPSSPSGGDVAPELF